MGVWSCQYCTLNNESSSVVCAACGSQNPSLKATDRRSQLQQLLPKIPKISLTGALNALDSALVSTGLLPPRLTDQRGTNNSVWHVDEVELALRNNPSPTAPILPSSSSAPEISNGRLPAPKGSRFRGDSSARSFSCSSAQLGKRDEEEAEHVYNRIVEFCRSNNLPFIDDSFPHSSRSIGDLSRNQGAVPCRIDPSSLVWLRPQDMFTKDGRRYRWEVFRDPRPTDIEQGALGNCWFLSALAVIAERPDILEQIMITKVYNPFGVYQIRLCVDGRWQVVVVDDFFPCNARTRGPAFAVGRRNQLWVPLIEKALAKVAGSYAKLLAGRSVEGLAVLTGAPCSVVDLEGANSPDSKDVLWASLLSMREARFIMGCSCGAGKRYVDEAEYRNRGLQARHAYSLLDVVEYDGHRLVRLRNPWGTFVWNGDWSDTWSGWTSRSRAALLPSGTEAGAFWMPFQEFLRRFDSVDVAKVRTAYNNWKELRINCTLRASWASHHLPGIRVFLAEPSEVAFTLYQKGSRDRTETDIMLLVHAVGPPNAAVGELVVRSIRKMAPFVSTGDVFLRGPAEYLILPISFSNINGTQKLEAVVAIHSAKSLSSERIRLPASAISDSLVELALKEGKLHSSLEGAVPRYVSDDFGGHLLVIDNIHERRHLQVHCDCSNSRNVLSTRYALSTVDSIPPLHRQIVMMLNHFEPTQSYCVRHSLTLRFTSHRELRDWVALAPGQVSLPANTEHIPSLDDPAVIVLHRPRPLFR